MKYGRILSLVDFVKEKQSKSKYFCILCVHIHYYKSVSLLKDLH